MSPISVGIDVAEASKGHDLVALEQGARVVHSSGRLTTEDVIGLIGQLGPAMVCIDSPSGWTRMGRSRAAERELRLLGISAFATPTDPGDHPFYRWMRAGISIFDALSKAYPIFRGGSPEGSAAEVFPEATAVLLSDRLRRPKESKATFRRLVLQNHGIEDVSLVPNLDRVDAALAAVTGLYALNGDFSAIGDPEEGLIVLPCSTLPTRAFGRPNKEASNGRSLRARRG